MAQQLRCPRCAAPVPAEDVNIGSLIGKCRNCNAIFEVDDELRRQQEADIIEERPHIDLPKGFEVQRGVSELDIRVRWRKTRMVWFYVLFSVIWNGVTFIFVGIAIMENSLTVALAISVHFMIGIAFLLYTISLFINSTHIYANTHGLRIKHGPMRVPFHPNRNIPRAQLEQLYVEEYVASRTNGRPNYAFRLRAVVKGQDKRPQLMRGLKKAEQALYLEHEIEKFMNIENRRVV